MMTCWLIKIGATGAMTLKNDPAGTVQSGQPQHGAHLLQTTVQHRLPLPVYGVDANDTL